MTYLDNEAIMHNLYVRFEKSTSPPGSISKFTLKFSSIRVSFVVVIHVLALQTCTNPSKILLTLVNPTGRFR